MGPSDSIQHRLDVHGANPECRVRTRKGAQGGLKHSSVRGNSGKQMCKSRLGAMLREDGLDAESVGNL